MMTRIRFSIHLGFALLIGLGAVRCYASEEISGALIAIDKSRACLQLGAVCYEISAEQKDFIIRQAKQLGEMTPVLIRLENEKVVGIGRHSQQLKTDENMPN